MLRSPALPHLPRWHRVLCHVPYGRCRLLMCNGLGEPHSGLGHSMPLPMGCRSWHQLAAPAFESRPPCGPAPPRQAPIARPSPVTFHSRSFSRILEIHFLSIRWDRFLACPNVLGLACPSLCFARGKLRSAGWKSCCPSFARRHRIASFWRLPGIVCVGVGSCRCSVPLPTPRLLNLLSVTGYLSKISGV